ncbi:hypothetical protein [Paenibacillus senegalensis]|uniref:hypothetical protein n=1 Tax=Paenibacillus senegalensis TaxID=1465766 RepID=UPI0011DDBF02|nr:hypothetical protein [Paenibacillus senegalensis]
MMIQTPSLLNKYFYIWALALPITSFLLIPSIQGTTIGYLMAFLSVAVVFVLAVTRMDLRHTLNEQLVQLFLFLLAYVTCNLIAQAGLLVNHGIDFTQVRLVEDRDTGYAFKNSLFTQSIYLFAAIFTFFFVKTFYQPSWNRCILAGAVLLAAYGMYEWVYFQLFHRNGDFLTNRVFNGHVSGSLFQTTKLFGWEVMRLKSLTGEPSMYAFTVLPFWIFAIHLRKTAVHLLLLLTLILSTSTTAYIGIFLYFMLRLLYSRFKDKSPFVVAWALALISAANYQIVVRIYEMLFASKLDSHSAMMRSSMFQNHLNFYLELPFLHKLFGVGFGYIRSSDMFTTLLNNLGLVGLLAFTALFMIPVFKLRNDEMGKGLKFALIVLFVCMMTSVPEFAYLPTWLFLGVAYWRLAAGSSQADTRRTPLVKV